MFIINDLIVLLDTILLFSVIAIAQGFSIGPVASSATVGKLSENYYPLTDDDIQVARDMTFVLDHFRPKMDKEVYPVPPLDPYHRAILKPIVFDGVNSPLTGTLNLYNATITGLREYSLDLIETRLKTNRLDFKISVPSLVVEADYDANLVDNEFMLFGTGHLRILFKNMQVTGVSTFDKVVTKERKFYVPVGLSLDINIKECDVFTNTMKTIAPPIEFIENIVEVITHSATSDVMEHVREILYLLPG